MKNHNETLTKLGNDIKAAEVTQFRALQSAFPKGSRCAVILMHGQKNPCAGTVVGWSPSRYGGAVLVEIDNAKAGSRYRRRSIESANVTLLEV